MAIEVGVFVFPNGSVAICVEAPVRRVPILTFSSWQQYETFVADLVEAREANKGRFGPAAGIPSDIVKAFEEK